MPVWVFHVGAWSLSEPVARLALNDLLAVQEPREHRFWVGVGDTHDLAVGVAGPRVEVTTVLRLLAIKVGRD